MSTDTPLTLKRVLLYLKKWCQNKSKVTATVSKTIRGGKEIQISKLQSIIYLYKMTTHIYYYSELNAKNSDLFVQYATKCIKKRKKTI